MKLKKVWFVVSNLFLLNAKVSSETHTLNMSAQQMPQINTRVMTISGAIDLLAQEMPQVPPSGQTLQVTLLERNFQPNTKVIFETDESPPEDTLVFPGTDTTNGSAQEMSQVTPSEQNPQVDTLVFPEDSLVFPEDTLVFPEDALVFPGTDNTNESAQEMSQVDTLVKSETDTMHLPAQKMFQANTRVFPGTHMVKLPVQKKKLLSKKEKLSAQEEKLSAQEEKHVRKRRETLLPTQEMPQVNTKVIPDDTKMLFRTKDVFAEAGEGSETTTKVISGTGEVFPEDTRMSQANTKVVPGTGEVFPEDTNTELEKRIMESLGVNTHVLTSLHESLAEDVRRRRRSLFQTNGANNIVSDESSLLSGETSLPAVDHALEDELDVPDNTGQDVHTGNTGMEHSPGNTDQDVHTGNTDVESDTDDTNPYAGINPSVARSWLGQTLSDIMDAPLEQLEESSEEAEDSTHFLWRTTGVVPIPTHLPWNVTGSGQGVPGDRREAFRGQQDTTDGPYRATGFPWNATRVMDEEEGFSLETTDDPQRATGAVPNTTRFLHLEDVNLEHEGPLNVSDIVFPHLGDSQAVALASKPSVFMNSTYSYLLKLVTDLFHPRSDNYYLKNGRKCVYDSECWICRGEFSCVANTCQCTGERIIELNSLRSFQETQTMARYHSECSERAHSRGHLAYYHKFLKKCIYAKDVMYPTINECQGYDVYHAKDGRYYCLNSISPLPVICRDNRECISAVDSQFISVCINGYCHASRVKSRKEWIYRDDSPCDYSVTSYCKEWGHRNRVLTAKDDDKCDKYCLTYRKKHGIARKDYPGCYCFERVTVTAHEISKRLYEQLY